MDTSDLKKWVVSQLTTVKRKEKSWVDLMEALAQSISDHVEGYIDRLKSRNSLYDMETQDLLRDTEDLRSIFPINENISGSDLPHVIMQRRDDIHFKKTIYPLIATIAREFVGLSVTWQPLYAPIDKKKYPYGSLFVTKKDIENYIGQGMTQDDFYMTSRGVIRVPINHVVDNMDGKADDLVNQFESQVRRVIFPLIPLRIVCDGQQYYLDIVLNDIVEIIAPLKTDITETAAPISQEEEKSVQKIGTTGKDVIHTPEERPVTAIYTSPRLGAVPLGAIRLDKRFY